MHDQISKRRVRVGAAAVLALAAGCLGLRANPAAASSVDACESALALSSHALAGPAGTTLTLRVESSSAACPAPGSLKKVQLKTFGLDGSLAGVRNVDDVASPDVARRSFNVQHRETARTIGRCSKRIGSLHARQGRR